VQVARAEIQGIGPGLQTYGYEKDIKLFISDRTLRFDPLRYHKERLFKPEDI
jgi:hypothetical protein